MCTFSLTTESVHCGSRRSSIGISYDGQMQIKKIYIIHDINYKSDTKSVKTT